MRIDARLIFKSLLDMLHHGFGFVHFDLPLT